MNCPHCGQTIKAPKAPKLAESSDTANMTDAQLFAYYKRTAPLADLRFWLNNARMSESLRAGFIALESAAQTLTIPRPAFYRQLTALQALWRVESNARDLQKHHDNGDVYSQVYSQWYPRETVVEVPTVFDVEDCLIA